MAFFCLGVAAALAGDTLAPPVHTATLVVRADPRTGRLVRSVVAPSVKLGRKAGSADESISQIVEETARVHDVDPLLVHSIIKVESGYNRYAISSKGAEGLMQIVPSTARRLGVTNNFDPKQNIEAGVRYLKYLQDVYKDDRLALAAYNAGPGAVDKYKWIPPYPETENYVYQVGKKYGEARRAAQNSASKQARTPEPEAPKPEQPRKVEQFIDEHGRLHLRTK